MLIDEQTRQQQAREIELELIRVRSAAEAARLEARAAELELLLRRMARGENPIQGSLFSLGMTPSEPLPSRLESAIESIPSAMVPAGQEDSWSGRLAKLQSRESAAAPIVETAAATGPSLTALSVMTVESALTGGSDEAAWQRVDVTGPSVPLPHIEVPGPSEPFSEAAANEVTEPKKTSEVLALASKATAQKKPVVPLPAIKPIAGEEEEETRGRFRPASWMVSTMAHVVVIILLGLMTLANTPPKDQLAFTASASESSEETMETFSIESSEPMETEPAPSETAYEISAVGTMAVTEVSMEAPVAPAAPTTSDFLSSSSMSSSMLKSLKSDSKVKTEFCGVEGGGNHFVYMVDSSGSMREGFQSARTELLASIDQLKPDQRFYVIFFDSEPDFMRISNPDEDEPGSVMATPDNKQRLRRWAMTIQQGAGRHPTALLPFVLKMRPDVIFLLSDGEFPESVGELLKSENRMENLFGESGPISIVHTIRYHGLEGETGRKAEATMVQIAKENGGQYRHVPKPR